MNFINSFVFCVEVVVVVDVPVVEVGPVVGSAVTRGRFGAKALARVEGIAIESIGIIIWGAVVISSPCLDCKDFSNFCLVSFSC